MEYPITGLSPYAAQGDAFQLAETIPSLSGNDMRVSGYGVDSGSSNQTLQTDEGDFVTSPNSYSVSTYLRVDTGVSGAAMEYDGLTFGIATRYQCPETEPLTYGPALNHPNLQAALANGLGVCEDCNQNTVPDIYEVQTADCNGSGFPDACDIIWELSEDCDGNMIPDECQADCNNNDVPATCDITNETSFDCDENGVSGRMPFQHAATGLLP